MEQFMMVKVHYDHRKGLKPYLKYSRMATPEEYQQYLNLFADQVGGQGFHECMNFWIKEDDERVLFYLPPGYIPSLDSVNNGELCIFYVTYSTDRELPSNIIGYQARCTINQDGDHIERTDILTPEEIAEDYVYHGYALRDFATLFVEPVPFDATNGEYMQPLARWSNGLRYNRDIDGIKNIFVKSYQLAVDRYDEASTTEQIIIERQLNITENTYRYYFDEEITDNIGKKANIARKKIVTSHAPPVPDKELGDIGEQYIFNQELNYAKDNKIQLDRIEWISRAEPYSPYDIKTVRKINGKLVDIYIEVKTTRMNNFDNVFISSNQVDFAKNNRLNHKFVFVNYNDSTPRVTEYSIDELNAKYDLIPLKFKVKPK